MDDDTYLVSFSFALTISGATPGMDAAFQEVSGLTSELGIEEVVCGGENRFKYRLPTTASYPNLVLKRGVALFPSQLIEWCQATLAGGFANPIETKSVNLYLLQNLLPCMSWTFNNAYPVKWVMGDMDANQNKIMIETIELAYQYFTVVDPRNAGSF